MKKNCKDLRVKRMEHMNDEYVVMCLTDEVPLPEILPGQFVELKVEDASHTFLRRPISVHFVDREANELWLLIRAIGEGTRALCALKVGSVVNTIFPLGKGFTMCEKGRCLLVGGGVGTAPLLYLGALLQAKGVEVTFLLGGRSDKDLIALSEFERYGRLCLTTEDGSKGTKGFVTHHAVMEEDFDACYTCGPRPMMRAIAAATREKGIPCEVSLENQMACGVGACLCCVEKTTTGNRCVCQDGPVFSREELDW